MHCASLGEFEQGRPLLEALKKNDPSLQVALSFFSPSGYEVMKDYKGADLVFYLPMDAPSHARNLLNVLRPSLVLWVKYEFWFHYLDEIKRREIPLILVSGIFRSSQPFFKWYGGIWRSMLGCFTRLFVQNEESVELLKGLGIDQRVSLTGDTRFDRVIAIAAEFEPVPFITEFCGNSKVLVAGSTWEEDEVELLHFTKMHPEMKFIIAPHVIDEENLADVKKIFPDSVFYSQLGQTINNNPPASNILIIDNMGSLSRLYKYAHIAYIGGGFGEDGVHNVLEAAVYGKPVVFGPVYHKFDEAVELLEAGGGISYSNPLGLEAILDEFLNTGEKMAAAEKAARDFVYANAGATQKIAAYIQENRLLTN